MKKSILLVLSVLFFAFAGQAQYTVSVTYQHTFTKHQVDSIITAVVGAQASALLNTHYTVKLYKVIYNTFGPDSVPTTASGFLIVPIGTPCEVPMLSYQHNSVLKKSDAPSSYGYNSQWFVGLAAGSIGNITLMPDGIGLGSGPGLHPYLLAQSEATSVIDMIRSVKEFIDTTGNIPTEQLFLAGVDEGAYASVAAHHYIQEFFDSTMHVTATGVIAGYYDMSGVEVKSILSDSTYVDPSYLPELLLTYNRAYNFAANDSDFLAYPYDSILPPLYNGNTREYQIDGQMPSVPKYVLTQNFIDSLQDSTSVIRQLLKQNDVYNWTPTSPVYFMYCIADEYVPFQHSIVAYEHFVQNGAAHVDTFDISPGYDHAECGEFSVLTAVQLINSLTHQPIMAYVGSTSNTSTGTPNGTVSVADSLGDAPYTWLWSTGDTTATVTGLAAGKYYVTTTDRAHCTNIDSVVVQQANGIDAITLANVNVYPNPTQGVLMIENRSGETLMQMEILDISGNVIHATQAQNGNTTTINMGEEAKGIYFLNLTSQSGKILHRKVVLL